MTLFVDALKLRSRLEAREKRIPHYVRHDKEKRVGGLSCAGYATFVDGLTLRSFGRLAAASG